jgi:hypothetical protein
MKKAMLAKRTSVQAGVNGAEEDHECKCDASKTSS